MSFKGKQTFIGVPEHGSAIEKCKHKACTKLLRFERGKPVRCESASILRLGNTEYRCRQHAKDSWLEHIGEFDG